MWAIVCEFGLVSGLRTVGAGLLSVRGTDRDVKGGVGVAQGRGEDVRRPQFRARDEPRDLHLGRAVKRLSCCVYHRSDRVVSTRGLAHHATRRVSSAGVEGAGLAGSTRHGFTRPSAAQAQADRVDVLLGHHHGAGVWVQAPYPHVIDFRVSKFLQSRASSPRSPTARASGASLNARSCPRMW